MLTCVFEYSQLGKSRFSTTKGLRITKMERNLFSVSPAVWAIVLCFKYITPDSKKSRNMQKDALLETDGKVNNRGRMNTFLRNGKPRRDKSHS